MYDFPRVFGVESDIIFHVGDLKTIYILLCLLNFPASLMDFNPLANAAQCPHTIRKSCSRGSWAWLASKRYSRDPKFAADFGPMDLLASNRYSRAAYLAKKPACKSCRITLDDRRRFPCRRPAPGHDGAKIGQDGAKMTPR